MAMCVAIIGGNLQGVEATYLAKKAGWDVLLIDRNSQAPASLLCDHFLPLTITTETDPHEILKDVELIIPAIENNSVLDILQAWSMDTGIPMAFDREAYAVSSSKKTSNQMFQDLGLSTPDPWPQCGFPMVVKPDGESGSHGVKVIHNQEELTLLHDGQLKVLEIDARVPSQTPTINTC